MKRSARLSGALILILSASAFGWSRPRIQDQKEGTGAIAGRVTLDGKAAPGVVVIATPTDVSIEVRMLGRSVAFRGTTDYDGHYRIAGLQAGHYKIEPSAKALVQTSTSESATQQTVADGQTIDDVNFSLSRGGVITG